MVEGTVAARRMNRFRLALSTSVVALGFVSITPAAAQDDEEQAKASNEPAIIVTGTRIKGVDTVGSAVIPIGREEMQKLGVSTTTDALRKLPQVINFGGSNDQAGGIELQASSLNTFFSKSVNLRGLGTASTLSLVNGHRVAPQGASGQLFDGDNIPGIALERIEVVADGGSAIYGSDAIGGVVNYIIRRPEDTLEAQFRVGLADSVEEYIGSVAAGRNWGSGGIFLAYEYQKRTALEAEDRPNLFNSDLSPYGGGANPIFANPGNVRFTATGPIYGIPAGQNGTGLTLGDLTNTTNRENPWLGTDAVPSGERHSVAGTLRQNFGDSVTFNADAFFSKRSFTRKSPAQTATLTVPNTNPFSPCYVGAVDDSPTLDCPVSGNLLVPYNFLNDLGPTYAEGYEQLWAVSAGLDIELFADWNANIGGYYSENLGNILTVNQLNTNGLNRALGATVAGTTKPASVPFFNPFCDGDAFDCNSDATLALFNAFSDTTAKYKLTGATANIGGSLFSMAGGDVRLAIGGEFHHDYLYGSGIVSNTRTDNVGIVTGIPAEKTRDVSSVYGEIFIPLFGPDNARPGFERLELNAAVRYDHYTDVGSTTNPKFGINYSPSEGINFRGSYGTSFRAPTLVDVNTYATAGFLPRTASGAAVGLSPADGSFQYVYPVGGNPNLKPEKATTWSVGVDITPELIPGVNFSITYYNITYTDKVDTAAYNAPIGAALNSGLYDDFVVYNPLYFPGKATLTIDQYVAYWNQITADPGLPVFGVVDPLTMIAIVDGRRNNTGVVKTDGLDIMFNYELETAGATFNLGAQANYTFHYKTSPVPGAPLTDQLNNFGYPARLTGKLELGVRSGGFSATTYLNHVNARQITRSFLPATVPDQYLNIKSYNTVDLTIRYDFDESDSFLTNGLGLSLSALNIFNTQPPLVVNAGVTPVLFDPSYSSSLGRFVSFSITKKFN